MEYECFYFEPTVKNKLLNAECWECKKPYLRVDKKQLHCSADCERKFRDRVYGRRPTLKKKFFSRSEPES